MRWRLAKMQQQKILQSMKCEIDCQHRSSDKDLKINALNGFVVFAESARQTTGKNHSNQLDKSNTNANTTKKK